MLSLKQLARTSKLYLTYGLRNERNRRRIMDVLQDNFKPLFGLGNLVYLLGHKHSYGPMNDLLIQSCKMLHKDRIDMIKESIDFRDTISSYENDLYAITEIIK